MQKLLSIIWLFLVPVTGFNQAYSLKAFPLSAVRLLESPFKQAQQTDLNYMLALNPDRLLAPYLREAGLVPKAKSYGNWESSGLDGHIAGHYLSALSDMYAATGNPEVLRRLNYMIGQLAQCQQKNGNGYVGGVPGGKAMWQQIANGQIKAGSFSLNDKWVPWYNLHKLYAGLVDAYQIAGIQKAKDILIKLSDWALNLTQNLSDDQMQTMLQCEHGGMNEVFANVAAITGDQKYLTLARRFSDRRILNPLLQQKDQLTGLHANTQIPKVIGYIRVAELANDSDWAKAAWFFWQTVVEHRTISIGGNSVREHFNPADDFSSMIEAKEGPETCNSYNMLKLTRHLFLDHPSASYMDYYERTLYNHILSSQNPKGGFVYFTPIRPRHYRVYSQPDQDFWCCVGSGLENHGKYGELTYAHTNRDLFINLFIPSVLQWKEKGITLEQHTNFPFAETSTLKLKLTKPSTFALHFRHPSWLKDGQMKLSVNNQPVAIKVDSTGYVSVERQWKTGDVITLVLPMQTKTERLPDGSPWISFVHGPIVLAAATGTSDQVGLWADSSRMGHIANGPLYPIDEAPMIVTNQKNVASALQPVKGKPLTFTAASVIYPDKYKNLKLVPFYQVQEARYMLYWPVTTPQELANREQIMHEKEKERLALEAQIVDQVAPGEQQPESDHNFKGEQTETGVFRERHWRHAAGWFSYDLKNPEQQARKLRVTYYGGDNNRNFDIYANGQLLKTVSLNGSMGDKFFEVDYELPKEVLQNTTGHTITVKFAAHPGSIAGGIYYVRLMK